MLRLVSILAMIALILAASAVPAKAIDGEVLITQAKALQGNVTPNDAAGFPVTITRPGVYKLASNLSVSSNKIGIEIRAHDVTIDLAGFRIYGNNSALVGIAGAQPGTQLNLTVRNGTIEAFSREGIWGTGEYWTIENMRLVRNGLNGARVGNLARIVGNTIAYNAISNFSALSCSAACHVEGNIIANNGGDGIALTIGTILGNTIINNKSYGIISVGAAGAVGFGNNTLYNNNSGGDQALGPLTPLHPNVCTPTC